MSDRHYRTGPWIAVSILGVLLMAGAGGFFVLARPVLAEAVWAASVAISLLTRIPSIALRRCAPGASAREPPGPEGPGWG